MDYDVDDTQRALRQDESISSPSSNGHQTQRDASRTQKSHVDSPDLQRLQIRDERSSDSARRPSGRRRSDDHDRPEPPAKDPQSQRLGRKRASTVRTCGKCNGTLTGQFVRALENTYHLECFTCQVLYLHCPLPVALYRAKLSCLGLRQDCRFEILSRS